MKYIYSDWLKAVTVTNNYIKHVYKSGYWKHKLEKLDLSEYGRRIFPKYF